jgi:hypothetical protein
MNNNKGSSSFFWSLPISVIQVYLTLTSLLGVLGSVEGSGQALPETRQALRSRPQATGRKLKHLPQKIV